MTESAARDIGHFENAGITRPDIQRLKETPRFAIVDSADWAQCARTFNRICRFLRPELSGGRATPHREGAPP